MEDKIATAIKIAQKAAAQCETGDCDTKFATRHPEFKLIDFVPTYEPRNVELCHLISIEYNLKPEDDCVHKCNQRPNQLNLSQLQLINTIVSQFKRSSELQPSKLDPIVAQLDAWSWILLMSFEQQGQNGAAFYNIRSNQLVIVHRGTDNWEKAKADIQEVFNRKIGPFAYRAYNFTRKVIENYSSEAASITVTGHSLGGWLAQVSTFFMEYPKYRDKEMVRQHTLSEENIKWRVPDFGTVDALSNAADEDVVDKISYHLHCISFEGPGCQEVIHELFKLDLYPDDREISYNILDSLDITVYLSRLNIVNTINDQLGAIFQMKCGDIFGNEEPDKRSWGQQMFGSHSSDKILDFWLKYGELGGHDCNVLKVTDWITRTGVWNILKNIRGMDKLPAFKEIKILEFRMSCFDKKERELIRNIVAYKSFFGKELWDKNYAQHPAFGTGVGFIGGDEISFKFKHDFQIIEITAKEGQGSEFLFRDGFIRRMKSEIQKFNSSGLISQLPNYIETVYISRTQDFIKTLPKFSSDNSEDLEPFDSIVKRSSNERLILLKLKMANSKFARICTAKLYELLFEGKSDVRWYLILDPSVLSGLKDVNNDIPSVKHVLIECSNQLDCNNVKIWAEKFYKSREDRKVIIISHYDIELIQQKLNLNTLNSLCSTLKLESLDIFRVQFKLPDYRVGLTDLVPLEEIQSYKDLDKSKLCTILTDQNAIFGSLIPLLNESDESYFIKRTILESESEIPISYKELIYRRDKRLVIITDDPGMGKTIIMQKLALESQKYRTVDNKIPWTIFINLSNKKVQESILQVDDKHYSEILAEIEMGSNSKVIHPFLSTLLKEDDLVRIFLDGLDEVNENVRSKVLQLVNNVLSDINSKARVFLAARNWLTTGLESRFKVKHTQLNPLSEKESIKFLVNFWTKHKMFQHKFPNEAVNEKLVEDYAKALLDKFMNSLWKEAKKFIGIPFQLRLLADAFMEMFIKFYTEFKSSGVPTGINLKDWLPAFTNLIEIYKLFIEAVIERRFKDKRGIIIDEILQNEDQLEDAKAAFADVSNAHRIVGFNHIFGYKTSKAIRQMREPETTFSKATVARLRLCGIVTSYKCDESEFIHRTIAEYLAADFILSKLKFSENGERIEQDKHLIEFMESYLFLDEYQNVLYFLNQLILSHKNIPETFRKANTKENLHEKENLNYIVKYFQSRKLEVDCLGRNLAHHVIMNLARLIINGHIIKLHCSALVGEKCGKEINNTFLLNAEHLLSQEDAFCSTPYAYLDFSNSIAYHDAFARGIQTRSWFVFHVLFPSITLPVGVNWLDEYYIRSALTSTCDGLHFITNETEIDSMCVKVQDFIGITQIHVGDLSVDINRNRSIFDIFKVICNNEDEDEEVVSSIIRKALLSSRVELACSLLKMMSESSCETKVLLPFLTKNNFALYERILALDCLGISNHTYILNLLAKHEEALGNRLTFCDVHTRLKFKSFSNALSDNFANNFLIAFAKFAGYFTADDKTTMLHISRRWLRNKEGPGGKLEIYNTIALFGFLKILLEKSAFNGFVHESISVHAILQEYIHNWRCYPYGIGYNTGLSIALESAFEVLNQV